MSDESRAHSFSEHHQRHVRTTFQYIDKLLSEAEHIMADAGSPSPFRRHSDDTTPIQRKVTHDYILRVREAMRRVMDELDIPPSEPHSGAVWAAGINLMYCSISLNELTPERMSGYGPLSSDAAHKLDGIRAELDGLVAKLRGFLGRGAGGDLQQRLQQLGKTGDEVRLLGEIERIVTAHGLVEFRGTLGMLLDRMEGAAFEAGVFGRVSFGKSSLLNYILQTDVLPISVTPVTAEREQMIKYVRINLRSQLHVEAPVHAVSVFGVDAALCNRWFESELRPFLAQHHELAIVAQKRKIGALREAVIGTLERQLQASSQTAPVANGKPPDEATEALRNGDRILERAQAEAFFLTRKITKMQPKIINAAAEQIAAVFAESDHADTASIFAETLTRMLAEPVAGTLRSLEQTRETLADAMQLAASASNWAVPEELPKPAGMPGVGHRRNLEKDCGRETICPLTLRYGNADISRAAKAGK